MKIAIIADTHAGARNDSPRFDAYFRKFFDEVFFPRLKKENIDTIIHLGDIFDRRKYVNFQTLSNVRSYFFDRLRQENIHMFVIAGNHDTFYKNTNDVNSIRLLMGEYIERGDVTVFDKSPAERIIGGQNFLFVPWICAATEQNAAAMIRTASDKDICIGHFELDGYQMFQGIRNEGGMNRKLLSGFRMVLTGHFHTRSTEDNIHYTGSPYEYTWSDHEDPRGFHILDTKTTEMEFIVNPSRMFHKIYYNEDEPLPNPSRYNGCCVKVIVMKKTDFGKFEQFIAEMYQQNVEELTIHEDLTDFAGGDVADEKLNMEDTMTLLDGFVDETNSEKDKTRLKNLLKGLYIEAQSLEV
jgi:DNA repair exonuclease SbcCD nuclease subunit